MYKILSSMYQTYTHTHSHTCLGSLAHSLYSPSLVVSCHSIEGATYSLHVCTQGSITASYWKIALGDVHTP